MTALDLINSDDASLYALHTSMLDTIRRISDLAIAEAVAVADKAAIVRKLVGKWRNAAELTRTALRLECLALRQIGLIADDPREVLSKNHASCARLFAQMTEADLEAEIAGYHGNGALGLRTWLQARARAAEVGNTEAVYGAHRQLRRAAADVVAAAIYAGQPVTVEAMAAQLAAAGAYIRDRATKEGARAVIRQAALELVRDAEGDDDEANPDADLPRTITVKDAVLGWVRIPWRIATVEQLQFMAALRHKQATDLAAKAAWLTEAAGRYEHLVGSAATLEEAVKADTAADDADPGWWRDVKRAAAKQAAADAAAAEAVTSGSSVDEITARLRRGMRHDTALVRPA